MEQNKKIIKYFFFIQILIFSSIGASTCDKDVEIPSTDGDTPEETQTSDTPNKTATGSLPELGTSDDDNNSNNENNGNNESPGPGDEQEGEQEDDGQDEEEEIPQEVALIEQLNYNITTGETGSASLFRYSANSFTINLYCGRQTGAYIAI